MSAPQTTIRALPNLALEQALIGLVLRRSSKRITLPKEWPTNTMSPPHTMACGLLLHLQSKLHAMYEHTRYQDIEDGHPRCICECIRFSLSVVQQC